MRFNGHFDPTFHPNRLQQPLKEKKPSTIFCVSMGDMFGDWVPDDWILPVLSIISQAHWHTFVILTKNPIGAGPYTIPDNCYFGSSADNR